MPRKLRLKYAKRGWRARTPAKTGHAENYRTGVPSTLFQKFCEEEDLNITLHRYLDTTEDRNSHQAKLLKASIKNLPKKIPSREGHAPIPGERDHYYLQFFSAMRDFITWEMKHYIRYDR